MPDPRPFSYNERMLEAGKTSPYFIWPNINPFQRAPQSGPVITPVTPATAVVSRIKSSNNVTNFSGVCARIDERGLNPFAAKLPSLGADIDLLIAGHSTGGGFL